MEKDKHLGLRIDSDTHRKLKSMAEFDGRSINGEVLYLIRIFCLVLNWIQVNLNCLSILMTNRG